MSLKSKFLLCGLAASSLAVASTGLYAAGLPDIQIDNMVVHTAGFDLNRPADVAKLYRNLRFAADQVCGPRNITGFYYTWSGYTNCVSSAMSQGVAAIHNASLTAYYQQQASQEIRVATK